MDLDEAVAILKNPGQDMHEWSAAGSYVVSYYNQRRDLLKPAPGSRFTTDADGPRPPHRTTDAVRSTTHDGATAMDPMGYLRSRPGETPQQYCARVSEQHRAQQARKATRDAARGPDWAAALDKAQNPGRTRDAETNPSGMGGYEFPTAEQSEMGNREGGVFPVGAEVLQVLPGEPAGYFIFIDGQGRACLCRHATANNLQSMGVTKDAFVNFARAKEKQDQRAMRGIASTVKNFWAKQNAA